MQCNRTNCTNSAIKSCEIVLYKKDNLIIATGIINVYVCKNHATKEDAMDLIDREKIERKFSERGYPMPDWELSYAHWVDVN